VQSFRRPGPQKKAAKMADKENTGDPRVVVGDPTACLKVYARTDRGKKKGAAEKVQDDRITEIVDAEGITD
jgi:hypothetical protein